MRINEVRRGDILRFAVDSKRAGEMDRMSSEFGIHPMQLMKNAGEMTALLAKELAEGGRIIVFCGPGNNGGDGLTASLSLWNMGLEVNVVLSRGELGMKSMPRLFLEKVKKRMRVLHVGEDISSVLKDSALVIDAILGFGLNAPPKGDEGRFVEIMNMSGKPILSIDVPSGLNSDTGLAYEPCVRAKATLMMGAPRGGLLEDVAREYCGQLYLADIGFPSGVYERLGMRKEELFGNNRMLRIVFNRRSPSQLP